MAVLKHWLVVLAGSAFLTASTIGTHVHLCFDGQEPPTSVHLFDAERGNHHAGQSQNHNDVDLDVAGQALVKAFQFDLSSTLPPGVWVVPTALLAERLLPVARQVRGALPRSRFLVPPLRAPLL